MLAGESVHRGDDRRIAGALSTDKQACRGNSFGSSSASTTFGESHGGGVGVVVDGCPPRLPLDRRGDPARPRPPPARPEPAHHAAPGGRPRRDPLGRVRGPDARHADRDAGAQRGRAPGGLRGHEGRLPPVARRLHLRGEVRHPQLAGRRPRERARDDRPRRGRRDRAQAAREAARRRGASRWVAAGAGHRGEGRPGDGDARRASRPTPCAAPTRRGRARWSSASTRRAATRRLARRRGRVRRARRARRAWASRCSTSSRPTSRKAMMSLPASKGFEIGSGFAGTRMTGSEHNDPFVPGRTAGRAPRTQPLGRRAGRHQQRRGRSCCASRSSRPRRSRSAQQTVDRERRRRRRSRPQGRHDPCVLPRAVPMVEAMMALVLADHLLRQRGQCG